MEHWHVILITCGIQILIAFFIAIIGFLLKRSISQIDKQLDDAQRKRDSIHADVEKLKETRGLDREYFAKEYVSKDDFIRDIRALDVKIDGVAMDVKELLRNQKENP
jgi:hypothetical protein